MKKKKEKEEGNVIERTVSFLLANSDKLKGSMNEPKCYAVGKKNKAEYEIYCGHIVDVLIRIEKTRGIYLKTSDSEINILQLELTPDSIKETARKGVTVMIDSESSHLKEKKQFESQLKKLGFLFSKEKVENLFQE